MIINEKECKAVMTFLGISIVSDDDGLFLHRITQKWAPPDLVRTYIRLGGVIGNYVFPSFDEALDYLEHYGKQKVVENRYHVPMY